MGRGGKTFPIRIFHKFGERPYRKNEKILGYPNYIVHSISSIGWFKPGEIFVIYIARKGDTSD